MYQKTKTRVLLPPSIDFPIAAPHRLTGTITTTMIHNQPDCILDLKMELCLGAHQQTKLIPFSSPMLYAYCVPDTILDNTGTKFSSLILVRH